MNQALSPKQLLRVWDTATMFFLLHGENSKAYQTTATDWIWFSINSPHFKRGTASPARIAHGH